MILEDESGSIRCTFFDDAVDLFYREIHEKHVCGSFWLFLTLDRNTQFPKEELEKLGQMFLK